MTHDAATYRSRIVPLLFLSLAALLSACGDDDRPPRPAGVGLDEVRTEIRTLVDTTRSTMANGDFPGTDRRTIDTYLWYADTALDRRACRGDRCALVILAHGFGGNPARFDAVGRRLAAAGYIVAAVRFPLTNEAAPGGHLTALGDVVNQPGDLAYVLDELLAADRDAGDVLYRRIDGDHVALLGHSLGGATVIAATRASCCTDDRIDANILVAPATAAGALFDSELSTAAFPTLIIQGSNDPVVPPASVAPFRDAIDPPSVYLELAGGGHVLIIEATDDFFSELLDRSADMSIAFLDRYLGGSDREALDELATRLRGEGHAVQLELN